MSKDFSEVRILVGQECGQIQGQILSAAWQKWRDKWANVKVLKAHPCPFIQILSRFYPDSIQTLSIFCSNLLEFIRMRWMFFKNQDKIEIKLKNLTLSNFNPHFGALYQSLHRKVSLYMSFGFWLFRVESLDLFQAERERIASNDEQIHKMTTIFTQNNNLGPFWVEIVDILWICSSL